MSAIPAKTDFTGAAVTEDGFKTAMEELHDFLTGLLGSDGAAATARAALGAIYFAAGTRMLFQQTAAPTGWTKETGAAYNDSALRIVTGAAATGGADAFSVHFGASKSVDGTALTVAQLPSHTHTLTDPGHTHSVPSGGIASNSVDYQTSGNGWNAAQTTGSSSTGISIASTGSGSTHSHVMPNFNIKYADVIIAAKD